MSDLERYRRAAEEMRVCALRASTPEIARGYRELARQWVAMARAAATLAINAEPWRGPENRSWTSAPPCAGPEVLEEPAVEADVPTPEPPA
jgi:hypothetical protein